MTFTRTKPTFISEDIEAINKTITLDIKAFVDYLNSFENVVLENKAYATELADLLNLSCDIDNDDYEPDEDDDFGCGCGCDDEWDEDWDDEDWDDEDEYEDEDVEDEQLPKESTIVPKVKLLERAFELLKDTIELKEKEDAEKSKETKKERPTVFTKLMDLLHNN